MFASRRMRRYLGQPDPTTCGPTEEHVALVPKAAEEAKAEQKGCCRKASEKLTGRAHGGNPQTCGQWARVSFAWFMLLWTFASQAGSIIQLIKIDGDPANAKDISFFAQLIWTCSAFFWFNYAMFVHEKPDLILGTSTFMSVVLNAVILGYVASSGNRDL